MDKKIWQKIWAKQESGLSGTHLYTYLNVYAHAAYIHTYMDTYLCLKYLYLSRMHRHRSFTKQCMYHSALPTLRLLATYMFYLHKAVNTGGAAAIEQSGKSKVLNPTLCL